MEQEFEKHFGTKPNLRIRCPGRVNLIGEHIDYMGYGVFPMAIEQETVVLVAPSDKPVLKFHNGDVGSFTDHEIALPTDWKGAAPPKWYDYFLSGWKGAIDRLGISEQKGMLVQVCGNVPHSSGLSSSSSLVCAAALATFVFYTGKGFEEISREDFAELCAKSEQFVGTAGGGMDQAAEVLSKEGKALRIDFNPLRSFTVCLPAQAKFVVLHCGDTLNKGATSQYNERVVECRIAATLLLNTHNLISSSLRLKDVQEVFGKSLEDMIKMTDGLPETASKEEVLKLVGMEALDKCLTPNTQHMEKFTIRQRAKHVFSEALRVQLMEKACEKGDLKEMGRLMNQSHDSCLKDYDCSCNSLDMLVEACRKAGALGARLTGAGWGGCAVALIDASSPVDLSNLNVLFESKPSAGISWTKL